MHEKQNERLIQLTRVILVFYFFFYKWYAAGILDVLGIKKDNPAWQYKKSLTDRSERQSLIIKREMHSCTIKIQYFYIFNLIRD